MSTITAAFVAEARRSYVPALAHLAANGWTKEIYNGPFGRSTVYASKDKSIRVEVSEYLGRGRPIPVMEITQPDRPESEIYLTSLTQAIDHLVTAGVLPVPFHSLAPKRGVEIYVNEPDGRMSRLMFDSRDVRGSLRSRYPTT
jgi:hypothetical protein